MKRIVVMLLAFLLITPTALAETNDQPSDWAKESITKAVEVGLSTEATTKGYTENINRQEFATLVVKLCEKVLGKELELPDQNPFVDTEDTYILKAYKAGIVNGINADHFDPTANIMREQIAVMYVNAMKMLEKELGRDFIDEEALTTFSDEDSFSSYAADSIRIASANGIISGYNNAFDPQGLATKEQALVLGLRSFYLTKDINEVIEKSTEYYKAVESLDMSGELLFDMSMEEQGTEMAMIMAMTFDIEEILEPIQVKMVMDGNMVMTFMGTENAVPFSMEQYMIHENDEFITYSVSKDPMTGESIYQKMAVPFDIADLSTLNQMDTITDFEAFGRYRLINEEVINNQTIYTVAMTINMDEDTIALLEGVMGDLSQLGVDSSLLTQFNGLEFVYKFDAATGQILGVEADLGNFLNNLINDLMASEELGTEEVAQDFNFKINTFTMKFNYDGVNSIEEIVVPEEVINNAVDISELLQQLESTEGINVEE